jgi:hypothetical protein
MNTNNIRAKTILNWLVPALLTAILLIAAATFQKVAAVDTALRSLDARVIAIESRSQFTVADGVALGRELDRKIDRDELNDRLDRMEATLDELVQ